MKKNRFYIFLIFLWFMIVCSIPFIIKTSEIDDPIYLVNIREFASDDGGVVIMEIVDEAPFRVFFEQGSECTSFGSNRSIFRHRAFFYLSFYEDKLTIDSSPNISLIENRGYPIINESIVPVLHGTRIDLNVNDLSFSMRILLN